MNNLRLQNHLFWGPYAPLSTLIGVGILIMASSRTAFALVTLAALVWVYALTPLIFRIASPVLPQRGGDLILVTLSTFAGGLFHLILWLISPLLAMETALLIILTPVCYIASGVFSRLKSLPPKETLIRPIFEALALGLLILVMALIREPLGFGSFSLPGGIKGIIEIFGGGENSFFSIQIIGSSAGALLLFGYGLAVFRREKNRQFRRELDESAQEDL
jgi:hypothetical protein